jgi:hypothetical protein
VSLVDRIEALARAKGWHADQHARRPPQGCPWLFQAVHHVVDGAYSRSPLFVVWRDGERVTDRLDQASAALLLLLLASGIQDVDLGPCPSPVAMHGKYGPCALCEDTLRYRRSPAQLVLDASKPTRGPGGGGQSSLASEVDHEARDALTKLASRLRDEALVLADLWQAGGVGLSTTPLSLGDRLDFGEGCDAPDCEAEPAWLKQGLRGETPWRWTYCHEHRPRDGYGYHLAVAIRIDDPYEVPPEHSPGREHGADGHSPMLWRLIERWLDPSEYAAGLRDDLSDALGAALQRVRGAVESGRVPVHVRLDQALRAGRTWMVLEPGDVAPGQRTVGLVRPRQAPVMEFTFDVRPYVFTEERRTVIRNVAVLRGSPEPPFPRAPELTMDDLRELP